MSDCIECYEHKAISGRVEAFENQVKDIFIRLLSLERNEGRRDEKLDSLIDIVKELKEKIEKLSKIPIQRWNLLVTAIITSVSSAIITASITLIITKLIK